MNERIEANFEAKIYVQDCTDIGCFQKQLWLMKEMVTYSPGFAKQINHSRNIPEISGKHGRFPLITVL